MLIGLDTRNTGRPGGTGVATYASILAEACHAASIPQGWLHAREASPAEAHTLQARFMRFLRSTSPYPRSLRGAEGGDWTISDLYRTAAARYKTFRRLTHIRGRSPPTAMHWTYPLPLHWNGIPNIVTIHDLIPLLHPDYTDVSPRLTERLLRDCCNAAHAVVTVSHAVKADIVRRLGVAPEKIAMLSQAVSFSPALLSEASFAKPPCPDGGFLYFGTIERRKNIGRLITAHGRSGTRRPLILIGRNAFGAEHELAALADHPAPERVVILPWCDRPALIQAIRSARAVVFPSLAEGFGLPIVEAMHLGTPVLTSAGHATGEIADDAALCIDPTAITAMTEALVMLDRDDELCESLVAKGHRRASDFDLGNYASRVSAFYETIPG